MSTDTKLIDITLEVAVQSSVEEGKELCEGGSRRWVAFGTKRKHCKYKQNGEDKYKHKHKYKEDDEKEMTSGNVGCVCLSPALDWYVGMGP